MHRTRHSSLDCLGGGASSQEEWSEFLSTSMMALSTADSEAPIMSPTRRQYQYPGTDIAVGRHAIKSRGMSMSEAKVPPMTADAWRPLGRRVASPPPTLTSSPESLSPPSLVDNQVEHHGSQDGHVDTVSATFGSTPLLRDTEDGKLKPIASCRGIVKSCLSSSGSSIYDSSSDDEQQHEPLLNQSDADSVLTPPTVDSSFADACLPVLSHLPLPPRSISVDSGNGPRAGSITHVKSPVLGNRKDAQTWQLQDEEFLMTSPRFGSSLQNPDGEHADLFRVNSVGSLLSTETSNQYLENYPSNTRSSKDSRALSVDFTLQRTHNVNPPLPPPQEPLQRLRARSFSYSPAYGSAGFNPLNSNKQYASLPYHHMRPHQQAMGQEFSQTLRSLHSGSTMMPSGQPQPPLGGARPPRVSIATDAPMHQYQYGPPMPYRRYSDAFAMPPYPDSFNGEQQENQPRQSNTGRGLRSYSVEFGNYTSTRQIRSQSMEGPQFLASAPSMEYPSPSLGRCNSAGVGFDWSHGHMESAPPLPPDVCLSSKGASHFTPPPPEAYYDVEFKRGRQEIFAGRASYKPGDYVKVEADRGEDIGRIVQRTKDMTKFGTVESAASGEESIGRSKRHDFPTKKILCAANQRECEILNEQRKEEHEVFEVCKSKVRQRLLPMNVIDAEYQFDRHKLTFFFEADRRIDFRELVRDLFAIYKTRIWLQQVVPSGKKLEIRPNNCSLTSG